MWLKRAKADFTERNTIANIPEKALPLLHKGLSTNNKFLCIFNFLNLATLLIGQRDLQISTVGSLPYFLKLRWRLLVRQLILSKSLTALDYKVHKLSITKCDRFDKVKQFYDIVRQKDVQSRTVVIKSQKPSQSRSIPSACWLALSTGAIMLNWPSRLLMKLSGLLNGVFQVIVRRSSLPWSGIKITCFRHTRCTQRECMPIAQYGRLLGLTLGLACLVRWVAHFSVNTKEWYICLPYYSSWSRHLTPKWRVKWNSIRQAKTIHVFRWLAAHCLHINKMIQ